MKSSADGVVSSVNVEIVDSNKEETGKPKQDAEGAY